MGYRSSIGFAIPSGDFNLLLEMISEFLDGDADEIKEAEVLLEDMKQPSSPDVCVFFSDYCKWPQSDVVLNAVEECVKGMDGTVFYRQGEDTEDFDYHDCSRQEHNLTFIHDIFYKGGDAAISAAEILLENLSVQTPETKAKAKAMLLAALKECE